MTSASVGTDRQPVPTAMTQMLFGGRGGQPQSTGDVGGKQLIVYAGNVIDSITIDNRRYGGGGGHQQIVVRIPDNGSVSVAKLGTRNNVVSYLQLIISDMTYEAGDRDGSDCVLEIPPLAVKFNTIFSGDKIDKLVFDILGNT